MRYPAFIILILLILVIPGAYALTASIGNARMVLRVDVEAGKITTIDKSIKVNNNNNISIKVALEPEDHYKKIIELIDGEFTLQPAESKDARFRINLKSGGLYEGKIIVSFAPANDTVKATPVGLSSTIIILANGTVTEDYYEVMRKKNETQPEQPAEENESISNEEETEEIIDTAEEGPENNESKVSVSIGSKIPKTAAPVEEEQPKTNPVIGAIIVAIIVLVGTGIFFMIKKLIR